MSNQRLVAFELEVLSFLIVALRPPKETQSVLLGAMMVGIRAANSKLNSNELDHFAELKVELEKILFLNSNLNSHKTIRVH